MRVGVLAFHGDVSEHIAATKEAAAKKNLSVVMVEVRTKADLRDLDALILPGGESTTLHMLCEREGMFPAMRRIPHIFGTCAGAILLARVVNHKKHGQKTLELMDIAVERNAYGRQPESAERMLKTFSGRTRGVFIRAPKITTIGSGVRAIAWHDKEIVACEERRGRTYYLATCFHPELTTTVFHELFLKQVAGATSEI